MKKSVIAALIFLIAMFATVTCFAAEYLEDDMNNLVTKTQRYDTYLSSAYFENNKSETNISTQNGEFSYRQTDYSLPGRNGLDLKIERMYRGNMTSLYEIGTKFNGSEWINVIETEWPDDNYLSFYEKRYNLGAGLRFSFPTIEAVKTSENAKKYLYLHSESGDVYRMVGPKETNGAKEYKLVGYELDDIKLIEDDETNPRYNINGWKSKYIFIDRNGTKTYFSDKKAYTSKPEDYEGCILGIVDRYGNEIKFEYTELSYTVGKHTQDQHTQKRYVMTKIIDTVGREVNITYLQNEDYQVTLVDENHSDGDLKGNFNVKIETPDHQMIVYDKSNLLFDSATKCTLRERIHAVYKLSDASDYSSTNYGVLQYWFWFEKADNKFDYNGSNYETCPELGGTYNQWENLNFIKYPGNKAKVIKYCDGTKKLGSNGSMTYRKVSEETDVLLSTYTADSQDNEVTYTGTEVKKQTYAYTNEPDGYRQWSNFLLYPRLTFEEGTTDQSKFTYSGNRAWYNTTDAAADGLRSLSNNSTYPAYLEFHLPETGLISFDYKVVPSTDEAKFTVNYEDRDWTFSLLQQTEECDWKHFEYFLPEGPYYRLGFHMYSGTVYLDNVSVSTYYSTAVTQEDGTCTTYLYDGLHRLVNTVEKGADHSITTRREYNDDMLPKRIESIQSCMENGAVKGVPITQIEEFEYDGFGNLLRHIGPEAPRDAAGHLSTPVYTVGDTSFQPGETVFQYDTEKYHKVTGRISANDENTILRTEYILDEMGNTIQEKRLHTEDGVPKNIITSLAYDSYGNIISKSIGGEDGTQAVTTYYDYEAAEGGADGLYLTR